MVSRLVGILHFTCPPIIGGVESLIALHSRLLLARGHRVRALAGRGARFHREVPLELIPALDSKHPPLLAVNDELKAGVVGPRFWALADHLAEQLRAALGGLDVCIVHNALSLHFNLPLTAALRALVAAGEAPRLIAWCHDLAWTNPLYIPLMREREPWSLLRTRLPGVDYVVVSEDRREDLLRLWDESPRPGALRAPGRTAPPLPEGEGAYSLSLRERAGGEGTPVVIPAGVDPIAKLRLRRSTVELADQLQLHDARPFMLLPARITKRKNIEYAIRVTRALRDLGLRPLLLVTGPPGPHNVRSVDYVDELQAERRALDVGAEVVFLYERRRADGRPWRATDAMMDDLYQLADLLMFPSAQEGFGIPLLEAGLVRLPVFCSDIPPFREIAGEAVHRFALDDPPSRVAERIARFLETDPTARLRRRVLDRFTWDRIFAERIEPLVVGDGPLPRRGVASRSAGASPPPSLSSGAARSGGGTSPPPTEHGSQPTPSDQRAATPASTS